MDRHDWEQVVWGNPALGQLGRIPTALRLLQEERYDWLIWNTCTQTSERQTTPETYRVCLQRLHRLAADFPQHFSTADVRTLETRVPSVSQFEMRSYNTESSVRELRNLLTQAAVPPTVVTQVSSTNHVARLLTLSIEHMADLQHSGATISAVAAHTAYNGGGPEQVVVYDHGSNENPSHGAHLESAVAILNAERQTIWNRFNTMLVANVFLLTVAFSQEFANSFMTGGEVVLYGAGLVLTWSWLKLTSEGWKYYRNCEQAAQALWGATYKRHSPLFLEYTTREPLTATPHDFLATFGLLRRPTKEVLYAGAVKRHAYTVIGLFFFAYLVLLLSNFFAVEENGLRMGQVTEQPLSLLVIMAVLLLLTLLGRPRSTG